MGEAINRVRVSSYSREATDTERSFYGSMVRALVTRRNQLAMTQEELDFKLQVSEGQIAKWEAFQRLPGAFMMVCWAQALGVTLAAVVPLADGPPSTEPIAA